ncbi:MAG: hypothetical protein ACR2G3_05455 [Solirubrobacterales bacterium]
MWHVPDDYYRVVAEYRPVGSRDWKGLDRNWCWTQWCALEEVVSQARYISRDGYIWRFQNPTPAPERATTYRFTESSYRDGTRTCAARLMKRSS